jgi:N-acyl-D-aspartate/D-glutamate deacylase
LENGLVDFKNAYDLQKRKSTKKARLETLSLAKQRGEEVDEKTFPSESSFYRAFAKMKSTQKNTDSKKFVEPLSRDEITEIRKLLQKFKNISNKNNVI